MAIWGWGRGAGPVGGSIQVDETELSFFGYHGTDAVYLKGTVL